MAERHRNSNRSFERPGGGREYGQGGDSGRGGRPRPYGDRGDRGDRGGYGQNRDFGQGRGFGQGRDFGDRRNYSGPPPRREAPVPPPPANEEFEDVDAALAVAILGTATKLTELVGTDGLPEDRAARRDAVVETFEAIYFAVLDAVTGGDEDEEEEEEQGEDE
jgi:hypothetical protein